jgi:hypothetical protein
VLKLKGTDEAGNVGAVGTSPPITYVEVTPTPSASPIPSSSPTPSTSPAPDPSVTVTPTESPTPTPTATPPPRGRRSIGIEVDSARLTRLRVIVRGALTKLGTGKISVRLRARRHHQRRSVKRSRAVRNDGRFILRIRLPRRLIGVRRGRLIVRYSGDATYRPARVRDVVGR